MEFAAWRGLALQGSGVELGISDGEFAVEEPGKYESWQAAIADLQSEIRELRSQLKFQKTDILLERLEFGNKEWSANLEIKRLNDIIRQQTQMVSLTAKMLQKANEEIEVLKGSGAEVLNPETEEQKSLARLHEAIRDLKNI